ncbi:uncharacterized protein BDW70DRAFT_155045 [Aspergillus foveolatus]|uniref:uncharacterized protein n=1 Tax=Aspergillus foveolatus TaxID=210207 RepID=UPI003CCE33A9
MNTFKLADYTIAWICALVLEAAAARAMLDQIHAPPQQISDPNAYEFGELNDHYIVIAYLPNGVYGTVSAAIVVSRMRLTFPRLQLGLMVGIGGGVSSKSNDIRLGDVVVSKPGRKHGGVIHYDYGKAVQGGQFEPTGILNQPPQSLPTHMSQLYPKQMSEGEDGIPKIVSDVLKRNPDMNTRFSPPARNADYLSQAMAWILVVGHALNLVLNKPAEVKEQIQAYLSSKNAGKWLLIFDNADDTDLWLTAYDKAPALENFLPQSEQGRILSKTRNWELAVELTYSNIVPIEDVDKEIARNILESLLLQKSLLKHDSIIVALLKHLEYLPLAIAQAAAYINKSRLDLAAYLTLLQDEEQDAVDLLSEKFRDPGRYKDMENAVINTWLISFKQIHHQDLLAADYLSFMARISPRNIPQSLLPAQISGKKRVDALGLLKAYNFINSQEGDKYAQAFFPNDHYTNRGLWRQYLPHALALVHESDFTNQQDPHINLVNYIANYLLSDGRYLEAEVLYAKLLEFQKRNGPEDPSTLRSMAKLESTYWSQGRLNEAEKLEVQVMESFKTVLGVEHPDTLSSMSNIASTLWNQGRFHEAEKLFTHVMETRKIVLGIEHPDTLSSMANLASTHRNKGRWDKAEKLSMQVMEARKRVLGPEHPDTLTSMATLPIPGLGESFKTHWPKCEDVLKYATK